MTATAKKYRTRIYTFWTYDVWGNARDGWEVNDRYKHGEVSIRCKAETFNAGTEHEFTHYGPTDRQLSRAVGGRGLQWDGEADYTMHAETKRGKPVCELCFERFADEDK